MNYNDNDCSSDVSSLDTHFKQRDGDEDNLWEVEAIVAERGLKYQVRWAGVDDNGAPWPLDWVPKEDCTDPLVRKWKKQQKARKRKRDEKNSTSPRKKRKLRTASYSSPNPPHKPLKLDQPRTPLPPSKVMSEEDESSIDQFDSPHKSHRPILMNCQELTMTESSTDRALPPAATDVINKGIALAEAAKRASKQNNISTQASKLPLAAILEQKTSRPRSFAPESIEKKKKKKKESGHQVGRGRESVSPALALEAFADSFVDYDGGVSASPKSNTSSRTMTLNTTTQSPPPPRPFLLQRQEEEEDTQDLMAEAQVPQCPVPATEHVRRQEEERHTQDVMAKTELPHDVVYPVIVFSDEDEEPVNVINSPEIAPTPSSGLVVESVQLQLGTGQPDSVQERSPSPSVVDDMLVVPATMSPSRLPENLMFPSQTMSDRGNPNYHLDSAMHLLNKKSEEIVRLERLVVSLSEEKRSLEVALDAERHRTAFAEKNAGVFREEYLRVSAFVDELRREKEALRKGKEELEERVQVAEAQVREGVDGVKAVYEARVERMEEEMVYHKRVATFCVEQSQRTQDEEIRRRAAECMEYEGRCEALEERVEGARGVIERLERLATMKDRENEVLRADRRMKEEEVERLKRGVALSKREMTERGIEWKGLEETNVDLALRADERMDEIESSKRVVVEEPSRRETTEKEIECEVPALDNGWVAHEEREERRLASAEVYVCMWRKEGREKCNAMFLSTEALKQHLELSGHLR